MPLSRLKQIVRSRLGERGGVVHSVGTLVGGTAFAQALTVLALPLLTRLYTPAEFSVLAVYAAVLGILVVVACLRLEIAIPLPETDEEAASLLVMSLLSGLTLSVLLGLVVALNDSRLVKWLHVEELGPYIWLVPVGVALASAYSAFQYWSTRTKKFPRIARTRMAQALGGVGVQLGAGIAGFGPIGLLAGHAVSGGAGVLSLARDTWKHDRHVIRGVSIDSMRNALGRYSRFPKYSTWEGLANTAGIQVPVILIAAWAVGPEAGYLLLATRLMAAPMALIGGSVAQVYLAHAPKEMRADRLGAFTTKILSGLVKTGVGPLMFAGFVAAPVAGIVFGTEWRRAGELVAWMTPWFILQFLSSPVSMVMHVDGKQRQMLVLTIAGFLLRIVALTGAYFFRESSLAEVYALSGAVFYGVCAVIFYGVAKVSLVDFLGVLKSNLFVLVAWCGAGVAVASICKAYL